MNKSILPAIRVILACAVLAAAPCILAAGCGGEPAPPTPAEKIMAAARAGDVAEVKRLLEADPSLLNARDAEARTPLHHAASAGSKAVVELLLEKGAEVSPKDKWNLTPLERAALKGHQDVVAVLMDAAADEGGEEGMTGTAVKRRGDLLDLLDEVAGGR